MGRRRNRPVAGSKTDSSGAGGFGLRKGWAIWRHSEKLAPISIGMNPGLPRNSGTSKMRPLHDIDSSLLLQSPLRTIFKDPTKSPDISSTGRLGDERHRRARVILGQRANHESAVMELSEYMLETLRKDGNFILYRGRHRCQTDASPPSILVVTPGSERPTLESLRRMEHEYSFAAELDPSWASRPLALSHHKGQMALVLENPGGGPLDRL